MAESNTSSLYTYEGKDKSGKRIKGEMSGQSDSIVKVKLRQQGIQIIKVKKKARNTLFNAL